VSRSLSSLQAVVLGAAVLVGLGLGALGLLMVGGVGITWSDSFPYVGWTGTFHVRAGFQKVHGVEVGTRVRVQGVDAGEVEAVNLPDKPGGDVVLRLRLKGGLRNLVRTDATAQIVSEGMVGGKVVEIDPGSAADRVGDDALIATLPSTELTDVLAAVGGTLQGIRDGEGTLGRLARDPEGYLALLRLLKQGERTMASVQEDADALKRVPLIGGYVEDPQGLLIRPNCERNRWVFAEGDLFEPGRAVLTTQGRQKLDEISPRVNGFKQKGAEVVVASYADPTTTDPEIALVLTRQRSEAVCNYLKDQHGVHKVGWVGSRKVTALGMGTRPPPVPEKDPLPPSRIEVSVFVPQG
jgi:phospholipid/cholesterol/gamma-HCH transport system substrate-binding protein